MPNKNHVPTMRELIDTCEKSNKRQKITEGWYKANANGTRTLYESIVVPEVLKALKDWAIADVPNCVLIGGLAVSFWCKPRATSDGDFLFISENEIPNEINGFKRVRSHAFRHNKTHVEIEVLSPEFLNIPSGLGKKVIETAVKQSNSIKVASKEGLIATKLNRFSLQDRADIDELLRLGARLDDSWLFTEKMKVNYQIAVDYLNEDLNGHSTPED
jgi:hypothetical protein